MELTDLGDAFRTNDSHLESTFLVHPGLTGINFSSKSHDTDSDVTFNYSFEVDRSSTVKHKRWLFLSLLILPVWILFGNLLVLISVIGFRHLRTLSNWVIASLAFTDFLLAITVVPLSIYQLVNQSWDLGLEMCLFWTGSDVFLSTTSIMHLCAIAIHRHLGIAYPLRMRRGAYNRRHAVCLLLPAWAVSAAVSASLVVQGALDQYPVLVVVQETTTGSGSTDDAASRKLACGIYDRTFAVYSSMVSFFVPLAVMIAVDFRSVQILRSGRRRDALLGRIADYATVTSTVSTDTPTPSSASTTATTASVVTGRESTITVASPSCAYSTPAGNSPTAETDIRVGYKSNLVGGACSLLALSTAGRLSETAHPSETSDPYRTRRSTVTSRFDRQLEVGVISTITSTRSATSMSSRQVRGLGGYGRFATSSRESMGVVNVGSVGSKLNSRERRAGRTLVWVFVIFIALWLPFFCANLAYGLCGQDHVTQPRSASDPGETTAEARAADDRRPSGAVCYIPEAVFVSFTWLGYLSSGVNPLLYTVLNADFQNAFRAILTCGYHGSSRRRLSRSNLFG